MAKAEFFADPEKVRAKFAKQFATIGAKKVAFTPVQLRAAREKVAK